MSRMTGDPTVAIGYVRVSTQEQNLGPDAQLAAMRRWADQNGVRLVGVHVDHGVSGGAELERRPGLLDAIEDVKHSGAGVLLVAKRDRLARDPLIAAMVEAGARRAGARVVSAAGEGTGSDDPTAVLMRRIVDAFAEYERLIIKARTRSALQVKKAKGERTGGIPFGWTVASDGRRLVPCPAEQVVLDRIHALRHEGMSLRGIVDQLNATGAVARGKRWHLTSVARLVRRQPPAQRTA